MNTKLILLAISIAAFSSCTTLYKSGQTPDDVYYSPARSYGGGETREEVKQENNQYNNNQDAAMRMGAYDSRWRTLDNNYYYSPYNYGFNNGYYYNPYFWPYPVYSPVFTAPANQKVTTPRTTNLSGYGTVRGYNNAPVNPKTGRTAPARSYNNNNGSAVGNAVRKVLGSDNNSSSTQPSNNNNNTRTYTPANNNTSTPSSGASSSGSSSGGAISRPPRAGI